MHLSLGFVEEGETLHRQRQQRRSLDLLKELADLPARGAVDTGVGDGGLPVQQVIVLLFQAGEGSILQAIILDLADLAFALTLVPGRVPPDHLAINPAKRASSWSG